MSAPEGAPNLESTVTNRVSEDKPAAGSKSEWEDVSYCVQIVQVRPTKSHPSPGFIAIGSAVGLRGDGIPFVANYALPQPTWDKGCNWEDKVKARLDTFLGCDCIFGHPCAVHKIYIKDWERADQQRLELQGSMPVPRPIEAMFKAQQDHLKSRIEAPRG